MGDAMQANFRNAGPSSMVVATQIAACRVFAVSDFVARKAANIGEIADYMRWGRRSFTQFKPVARREQLWGAMLKNLEGRRVRGFEFGVAWGYSTAWWLTRLNDPDVRWDGFDRFTGLPRRWRDLPGGHFDAHGQPPKLLDPRVTWHVGDVEDQVGNLELSRKEDEVWVILFDLDVFEPSFVAWERLKGSLRPGDLLYFDEAFDRDERHLLDHHVLPTGSFSLVGATPLALCLEVIDFSAQADN